MTGGALAPAAWGQGIAREALQAVLDWAHAHLAARRTACLIGPDNRCSIQLAAEFGYREAAVAEYEGEPMRVFERPAAGPRSPSDRPAAVVTGRLARR
ncbi:acetyltransferase family protein [Burkholderia thailandensis USAMRU Malaysia |nr:acetyltransferase family protein [Burkholderia thailandensis 2002721723]AHI81707.1 acetyltransferase family protein [Burkholderia thailandensis E444]AIC90743.1 acetyltransferase family protein [Burkholderia thailandensis USAMRU Malaysia \